MWPDDRVIPSWSQMRALGDVALRLHRIPKPTIAKVGGVAAGAGMSMALGCDLVVASDAPVSPRSSRSGAFGGLRRLVAPAPADRSPPGQGAGLLRRHHRCRARPSNSAWSTASSPPTSWTRSFRTGRPGWPPALRLALSMTKTDAEQLPQPSRWTRPSKRSPVRQAVNFATRRHHGGHPGVHPEARATVRGSLTVRAPGSGAPVRGEAPGLDGVEARTGTRPGSFRQGSRCDTGDLGCRRCFERPHAPCVNGAPTRQRSSPP